ncbi:MAG: branched-chain amino acid ABC transporter substrate-binding protein [Hyphomicrobiales bacterium]|nr:branched-chain amino acid ABC transporter substrate-binding protein [Hyphomicrobiales bacterium]
MRYSKGLVAFASLLMLAAAFPVAAQEKGTFKIVTQTPLSGDQSLAGEAIKLGVQLSIEDFGGPFDAAGYKVVLQAEDDQASPTTGVANANRIINDPEVIGVVGHYNSGVSIPASEVYAKVGLTMISPSSTSPTLTERESTRLIANRVSGRDDVQGPAAANFAINTIQVKRAYIINDKTAYGSGLADAFEKALTKLGGQVVLSTGVDQKETDFSTILNRARLDKPDLIFYGGTYPQGGLIIKQIREKGLSAKFLGGDGLDSSDLQKIAGADNMTDIFFTTTSVPFGQLPTGNEFGAKYKAKFGRAPEGFSAYGYDAAHAILAALEAELKAGVIAPSREAIAAQVRKVDFDGLTGHIAFNGKGDIKEAKYVVVAVAPDPANNKVVSIELVAAPLD